jgi:hypothetical protein
MGLLGATSANMLEIIAAGFGLLILGSLAYLWRARQVSEWAFESVGAIA